MRRLIDVQVGEIIKFSDIDRMSYHTEAMSDDGKRLAVLALPEALVFMSSDTPPDYGKIRKRTFEKRTETYPDYALWERVN